jgi:predicted esterase
MKKLLLCLSVLVTLTVSAQQVPKSLTAANGQFIGFYQYTPTDYTTSKKYPVIISLHGVGEKGNGTTELNRLLGIGVAGAINGGHNMTFTWNGKTETFLVLSPQLDGKYGSWQNFYVEEMINYAKRNLSIDENRIFLTGLSLGGGGTWSYAGASLDNAKKLAAIGVCCGTCPGINFSNLTNANLPVWAFHAQDDATVGAGCTTGSIYKMNELNPAVKPYMTLWPDGQHWIWGRVYSTDNSWQNPNLYEWFLGQDKSKPVNKRPVANAGNPLSILTGLGIVTLSGAGSTDEDGKIVRYIWRKLSGPAYGTINASISLDGRTTVTGLNWPGTYVYELTVVDDRADWSTSTVTVTVGSGGPSNQAPVVNAGSDQTITLPASSVTLNGSATDADGSISKYAWTKVSGGNATFGNAGAASTTVSGLTEGTYSFRLTATDNVGATGSNDVTVTVKAASIPSNPGAKIANAGPDKSVTTASTTLDGSGSVNPDGPIYAYTWAQISGPSTASLADPKAKSTTASNLKSGKYSFSLTIWDHNWRPQADTMVLTVSTDASQPPPSKPADKIADAGADKTITLPTSSLTLDGSGSVNPDGPIYAWTWAQISGPSTATIANPKAQSTTASNLKAGTYRFSLTIWDHNWRPQADTMQVVVNNGTTPPPPTSGKIADAGDDKTITLPVSSLTLDGSGSVNPNGPIYAWTWKQISGPVTATLANAKAQSTTASGLTKAGTYRFSLTTWDHNWRPEADTMQVIVKAASSSPSQTLGRIANAGDDLDITLPDNSIVLDGSNSVNPDGPIYAYTWNQISGPTSPTINNAKEAIANVTGLVEGTYVFRFTIWDHTWRPQADTMEVVVNGAGTFSARSASGAAGNGTISNAGADITVVLPSNSTTLNGGASADPKGVIRAWQWVKVSGPEQHNIANASQSVTTLSNLVEGTYRFSLTVWGNDWTPFADTVEITVVQASALTGGSNISGITTAQAVEATSKATVAADKLLVYPNPAQAQINVQTNSVVTGASFVNIYDMAGKLVLKTGFQKAQPLHQQIINVSKLLPGVYHLEVVIDNQKRLNSKFIKQ